jgi:arylsulfatase A-like enzyme
MRAWLPGRGVARRETRRVVSLAPALLRLVPLLALVCTLACGSEGTSRGAHPPYNVVLITLDTTRADHLGLYGYRRATSPTLDRLGTESQVFDRAYSSSSWTLPAHASLFTSMLPTSHGADKSPDGALVLSDQVDAPESWKIYRANPPRSDVPMLAEVLARAGYATGAFVGGPWLKRVFGLSRGFATWDDEGVGADGRSGAEITYRARTWLGQQKRPFFLFLNYFDAHTPYRAPRSYAKLVLGNETFPRAATQSQVQTLLYDAEIRFADDQMGLLFGALRQLGLYDATWIVVTADHGELLGEHGREGHGLSLDQELVRVPLVVKPPAGLARPGRRQELVELTDVMPMLLDALGLPIPASAQGSVPGHRTAPVVAEVHLLPAENDGEASEYRAIIEGNWKLVWKSDGASQLFDLARDPQEARDLALEDRDRVTRMSHELKQYVDSLPRPPRPGPERAVDPETAEALRHLGYVK